ncbi:unnamed protein product [Bursaphelenchus okinawaensis]|uniref:Uncharacterized protein n=1 Tax=Bursaphelenchus okinawaensis TaxID=465554 RepID=A0A811LEN0_9BILA|nr:unnamed protein product [Bursaphelenchus okinawaensis]CAG9121805.1 unnamed protein product [Bursaphelenchus okinawaensis]
MRAACAQDEGEDIENKSEESLPLDITSNSSDSGCVRAENCQSSQSQPLEQPEVNNNAAKNSLVDQSRSFLADLLEVSLPVQNGLDKARV